MTAPLLSVTLARPWLVAELGAPQRVLSFAPYRPGFVTTSRIVWRELRNADLPPDLSIEDFTRRDMTEAGYQDAVGLLTSRDIGKFQRTEVEIEGSRVACVATVGLGNAERIGTRTERDWGVEQYGTINIGVQIADGLTETAQIEALTIAAEARTAAVMEAGLHLRGAPVTGTGTDCIAIASPAGDGAYAGLHTALGEAIGRAVYQAVAQGAAQWVSENPMMMQKIFRPDRELGQNG
ncbi:adenosylcobinamide amidohydrolase [Celeribacter neptunius]|uniref:Adenosylcobinamide amidohydrolase n=1 Tax=Celeribacter neptunius TaxID=588602 RepID=A0A1I3TIG3_9RHOB|nr:adenosylcobinamide amidohydrolase [Celeribacter neptunius]SFJ70199.1 Adenosylcobinamide amidohydrolase [Celeribacter neptunius]